MTPEEKTTQRALDEQARKEKANEAKLLERREAARWQRIFRVYGITKEQYDELDKGYCPVCERVWSGTVRPVVDHDHHTGDVRGILCFYCNHRVIGRHRDGNLIQRAADYLKAPRKGWIVPKKKPKKRKKSIKKVKKT